MGKMPYCYREGREKNCCLNIMAQHDASRQEANVDWNLGRISASINFKCRDGFGCAVFILSRVRKNLGTTILNLFRSCTLGQTEVCRI